MTEKVVGTDLSQWAVTESVDLEIVNTDLG